MDNKKYFYFHFFAIIIVLLFLSLFSCKKQAVANKSSLSVEEHLKQNPLYVKVEYDSANHFIEIENDINVKGYFDFLDKELCRLDSTLDYQINEHILINANPWIIDNLINTDYYIRKDKGEFVYNQSQMIILNKGDSIVVPNAVWASIIKKEFENTLIDINIPEFTLRLIIDEKEKFSIPIRVGRDEIKYLEVIDREEDLKTKIGEGHIFKINRFPLYINPATGKHYKTTRRDDNRVTKLPQIPFLHPIIEGHKWGQLIHPTTNPKTLGKAYSNGCIGTSEADAWRLYYHAPVGTKIKIRYDLNGNIENESEASFEDVYNYYKSK